MKIEIMDLILNPFILIFATVVLGMLFGKIKFGKFSFGTSGAMFVGLVIGWAVFRLASGIYDAGDESAAGYEAARTILETNNEKVINSGFFTASLILFVAAVGLLAAKDIGYILRKYGPRFIIMGLVITFVGAGITYTCTGVAKGTNNYAVTGVYTGAMTSSPGLASALESTENHAKEMSLNYEHLSSKEKASVINIINLDRKYDLKVSDVKELDKSMRQTYVNQATAQVGIGSAVAYPFGVVIVILAVNFLSVIFRFDVEEEKRLYREEMARAASAGKGTEIPTTDFSITSFALVCFLGYLLGSVRIYAGPLGYISLEATGGVLIGALILGYIGKIGPISFRMDPHILSMVRELGLVVFLAIVGLNYGYGVFDAIMGSGLTLALIALIVGFVACMAGFLLGRYVFKLNWILLVGALCGGMTSTPGLGAATDAVGSDEPGAGYGATYPFALVGMVIFSMVLQKLPLL
ncbi:membrane protein [Eubacterium sp. AB3007]|uniref:aspartate-alanine antiporter-like transporter n=1 Tax=Eubacterium sp. AB3007 TaxID=1392487 RepID=UPI000485C07C|nr:membrane protein [Eubacterium sp. AB3007]